jgi:hypothetical protein
VLLTLQDGNEELLRIAGAVAVGELDHATAELLVAAVKAFCDGMAGVKTEQEIAQFDELKTKAGVDK